MLDDILKLDGDTYTAVLPYGATIDFARYFIERGILLNTVIYKNGDNDYRMIVFHKDNAYSNLILTWLETWHDGHEVCPFCGAVGELYEDGDFTRIRCTECGCTTRGRPKWAEDEYAWEQWDKRVGKE